MKKIKWLLLLVFILLPVKAHAADFGTSLGGNQTINAGSQFTITVSAVNATNLMGLDGALSFDSSKISFVSASSLNGYAITVGSNLVADNTTGNTGTFGIAILTFRATGSFTAGQSTTISLSNVGGTNGSNLFGTGSSVAINVAIPKSTNSDLSSLTVNNSLVSGFNSGTKYYTLTVNNNISSISIGATVADGRSWVSGIGSYALNVYSNTFYVTVTSESGNRSVYTINIIRKDANGLTAPLSTNNLLGALAIEGYNIGFDANKLEYALTVENNISSVKLTATPQDSKAKVATEGDFGNLEIGDNLVKIIVTAENGDKKTYTVTIKRKEEGPTTTLDQLIKVIDSTTAKQINVEIKDEKTVITSDMISSIKKSSKNLTINYYNGDSVAYKWEINGAAFDDISSMDVGISFDTDNKDKIADLTNYADNLYLNFAYSGALPSDTYISINVSSKYKDGDVVNLYYYDDKTNEIKLVYDDLKVKNGYLKFSIDHCSEYILSMANYMEENNDNSGYKTVCYFLGLAVICLTGKVVYDFLRKKQKNNLSK